MRIKKLVISCEAIKRLCATGSTHRYWVEDGIPEDAKVVGVFVDPLHLQVVMMLTHPYFHDIAGDDQIPEKMVWCQALPEGAPVGR